MSDDFLAKCTSGSEAKSGLIRSNREQREHDMAKKRQANHEEMQKLKKMRRSVKEIESDNREEGLATSIQEAEPMNKGLAMLARMGYKAGESLGKDNTGRIEPIGVEVKIGRAGLGRETALKDLAIQKCKILEARAAQMVADFDPAAFRAQMRQKHNARRTDGDLFKAQKSCRDLDEKKGFQEAPEAWFWPPQPEPEKDEDDEDDDEEEEPEPEIFTPLEKLGMILNYLRTSHSFCIFCGIEFQHEFDMDRSCPGLTREEHENSSTDQTCSLDDEDGVVGEEVDKSEELCKFQLTCRDRANCQYKHIKK